METQATPLYNWLKHLPTSALRMDAVPLLGTAPEFPWEKLREILAAHFQVENLTLAPETWQARTAGTLTEGLGTPYQIYPLSVAPLEGEAVCFIAEQDMTALLGALLGKDPDQFTGIGPEFKHSLTEFVLASLCQAFTKTGYDKQLAPRLLANHDMPDSDGWTLDMGVTIRDTQIRGRFYVSQALLQSWRERYAQRSLDFLVTTPRAAQIDIVVHIEAGRTALSLKEWRKIKIGDFLLLDSCSLTPQDDKKGRVMLTVNGMPCFRAKLRTGGIKLLEHPLNYEVDISMADSNKTSHDYDDSDFESIDESLIDDQTTQDDATDSSLVEHFDDDEEDDASFQESSTFADTDEEEEDRPAAPLPGGKPAFHTEEITLPIVIELGRIQMPIQKLLELQPGNLLDLDIHPENGVDLVVNGKRIGKGEVLKIGESLGVRILDIC